ncbi:variant surface glycoprotein (VSG, atypical), putative [Trypanosoma brucei brucei TREU927]|uniref:Variant surface glycoprotein (VSG, atypical), putative n=1 Tax=Trypanosoma brucei brucei (strain 927/4 GUTat10.1) TaxID=185431 RepID=Q380U6_TRYB2|nr:variant surface glycoprotein [Trypanosoma brucei brucei TREU927]EAN80685.1 variant surface glycoprotein (VSG, atypical), putative [Trypanosoma brucei brucei TREU927]
MTPQATALLALALTAEQARGNIPAGANEQEFGALCAIVDLSRSDITINQFPDQTAALEGAVLALNMSLADESWQKRFSKDGAKKEWIKELPAGTADPGHWKKSWPKWAAAAARLADQGTAAEIKSSGFETLNPIERAGAKASVAQIAAEAQFLTQQIAEKENVGKKHTAATVKAALNEAIYGVKQEAPPDFEPTRNYDGLNTQAREAICVGLGSEAKTTTIAGAIYCICGQDNAQAEKVCARNQADTHKWTSITNAMTKDGFEEIVKHCAGPAKTHLTSSLLMGLITKIKNLIRRVGANAYMGALKTGSSCNGDKTQGICIKYAGYDGTPTKDFAAIPWAQKLLALHDDLRQQEKAIAEATALEQQLAVAKNKAYAAALLQKTAPPTAGQTSSDNVNRKGDQGTQPTNKCNQIVTEETCNKENECSYEKESDGTKRCKYNATKATANGVPVTQPQKGPAKTTENKCKWKPEKDFKSPDCKWDGKECKNSSIIANKQFAMIVSAFVAMVF